MQPVYLGKTAGEPVTISVDASQAAELRDDGLKHAPAIETILRAIRDKVPTYADDRPLAEDVAAIRPLLGTAPFV